MDLRHFAIGGLFATALACGESGGNTPDGGATADGGDAGQKVVALCPPGGSACQGTGSCGTPRTAASNCPFCSTFGLSACPVETETCSLCGDGACVSPAWSGTVDLGFRVEATASSRLQSFAALVLGGTTGGGLEVDCAAIRSGAISLASPCLNVLDAKGQKVVNPEDTYHVLFNRIATVDRAVFVVYGFETERPEGQPYAMTCAAGPVTEATQQQIDGDTMRLIQ